MRQRWACSCGCFASDRTLKTISGIRSQWQAVSSEPDRFDASDELCDVWRDEGWMCREDGTVQRVELNAASSCLALARQHPKPVSDITTRHPSTPRAVDLSYLLVKPSGRLRRHGSRSPAHCSLVPHPTAPPRFAVGGQGGPTASGDIKMFEWRREVSSGVRDVWADR